MTTFYLVFLKRTANRIKVLCALKLNSFHHILSCCQLHGTEQRIYRYFSILFSSLFLFFNLTPIASASEVSEYRLKAAFLYNFIAYTRWPDQTVDSLRVCIHGEDPFDENLQYLKNKKVNETDLLVQNTKHIPEISDCQVIFISNSAIGNLNNILDHIKNKPVLTISDSINAGRKGIMINMTINEGRIEFNVNLNAVRNANLELSAQLLRLAKKVYR